MSVTGDLADAYGTAPLDAESVAALRAQGLDLRLVPTRRPELDGWKQADSRGFLYPRDDERVLAAAVDDHDGQRVIGVYDDAGVLPEIPVGTFASWVTELSVPGADPVPAAAITSVTVAPTHTGRGIARAMMTAELRHAARHGLPFAALTASDAGLYGRYGFAAAASATRWRIDTRRAGWIGPNPPGRVDYTTPAAACAIAPALHERIRAGRPGEIRIPDAQWRELSGLHVQVKEPAAVRAVQYRDMDGQVRGVAWYTATENPEDFPRSHAAVRYLVADGPEAYAGLWRFLLRLPAVGTLTAEQLSVDEPLVWMLADQRAAVRTVYDHQYVRVLDVAAALRARRYPPHARLGLQVDDPLGIDSGTWMLRTDADGSAEVTSDAAAPTADTPVLRLGTAELSAVILGGVSVATLAAAGRLEATDPAASTRLFASVTAPRLSFWY